VVGQIGPRLGDEVPCTPGLVVLESRRANRPSSRSTRCVVIASLFCMVGPPSGGLPLSEDQPRIKLIPYVGISETLTRRPLDDIHHLRSRNALSSTTETRDP
jgi:hypothetical protein